MDSTVCDLLLHPNRDGALKGTSIIPVAIDEDHIDLEFDQVSVTLRVTNMVGAAQY